MKKHTRITSILTALTVLICAVAMTACNTIDYSDYGFENMGDMNTWLYIEDYDDFSDEPYVWCSKSYQRTCQYSNNYITTTWWDNYIYNENDNAGIGETYQPLQYDIVSNDSIVYKEGLGEGTFTITERVIVKGAPILYCQDVFQKWDTHTNYNWSLPTGFIDWSKSPEESTMLDDEGNEISVIKYYIK